MDISTALSLDLKNLLKILDLPDLDIERSLRALRYDVAMAVSGFVGLSMTVVVDGQRVTLTSMSGIATSSPIGSSLALPLSLTSGLADGSALVLYATTRGAFVDLAADLSFALDAVDGEVVLDQHLTPEPTGSGIAGVEELTLVNRAVGILIGRGATPDEAREQLQRRADEAGVSVVEEAAHLVGTTE